MPGELRDEAAVEAGGAPCVDGGDTPGVRAVELMEDVEDDRFCRGSVESLGVVDQDGQAWVGGPQLAQSHPVSGRDEVEIPYAAQPTPEVT